MKYNTAEKHLAQPEYGRNVQNLVDYCVTIEDREERNRCANAIMYPRVDWNKNYPFG